MASDSEANDLLPADETEPVSSPRPQTSSTSSPSESSSEVQSPSSSPIKSDVASEPKRRRDHFDVEIPEYREIYWPARTTAITSSSAVGIDEGTISSLHVCDEPISEATAATSASSSLTAREQDVSALPTDEAGGNNSFCGISESAQDDSSSDESSLSSDEQEERLSDSEDSSIEASLGSQPEELSSDSGDSVTTESGDVDLTGLKVYDGCNLSVDEGVCHVMNLFISQKLSKTTLSCVLQLLRKFLPEDNNFPETRHTLFKYVQDVSPPVPFRVHFYCESCFLYIGEQEKSCPLCGGNCNRYFQLSLADQIRSLFENHGLAKIIEKYSAERAARQVNGQYFDICDASEYKRVQQHFGTYNLTLLGHTDGVSISNSSTVSLWPLEFVICEIPPHLRFKYLLIAGVWVDKFKPSLHCFLEPFAHELELLSNEGVLWINPDTHTQEKSTVVAPFFCADAPVRANLQNILEVAGKRSCNCCEQKTVKLPPEPILPGVKKVKRKRVFVPREVPSTLRTAERMETQGRACLQIQNSTGKTVAQKGVKGVSILYKFPTCDPSKAVFPEYMHGIMGIMKQFMELWMETPNVECSLKPHRAEIDLLLEGIREPDFVTRFPKSTRKFSEWKANDCRSFLLYASLPVLSQFMTAKYVQHWMLLVASVYLLLQDIITENDVEKADVMLKLFLRDFTKLYPIKSLTYNLHNLCHYGLTVRRVGPLWANSAFPWEDFNGKLEQLIHGTKNQGIELVKTIQLFQGVQVLKARVENANSGIGQQCDIFFRNRIERFSFTDAQKEMLASRNLNVEGVFYRAIVGSEVLTCRAYTRQKIKNNFTVSFTDDNGIERYGEILSFVEGSDGRKMAFVEGFLIDHDRMFCHESGIVLKHLIPIREGGEQQLIPVASVRSKVIRVGSFVCTRPNKYEANL